MRSGAFVNVDSASDCTPARPRMSRHGIFQRCRDQAPRRACCGKYFAGGGAAAAIMTSVRARARALSNIENVINNRDTLARGNCGRDNLRALYTRPEDFPIRFHRLAAACNGASSCNHLSPRDEQRVPNLVRSYLLCFAPPETRPSRARARAPLSRTGVCCPLFRCDSISIDGLHSTDVIKYTSHRSG